MTTETSDLFSLLIVDDSRVSRMMIRAFVLDKNPTWQITEASSGDEAMKLVEQHRFDFCTMDINMPGTLGTVATEQILLKYPHMRIAVFSANIQECLRTHAAKLGARFVAKPVTEKSVEQAITFFKNADG
ncbi:response regulator transcription factor [Solimicrobium silvestre]|uniref:Response regulator receiver domain n=1 Tax=Solimicrobium silvestre TaxID=2099400 RepID=A0A2S9GZ87_9BURK|nr:response regulator [Solimicrobium silvestre]PRC93049.1 Response regulator receiver domain [Solimicrobium silvestre]